MVKTADFQSLAADVHTRLRTAIMTGKHNAGERLLPSELAKQYGVSPSVVREALTRLSEQRLAIATPNRGFYVAQMTVADMHELVEVRVINEVAALRLAVENGDVTWESGVIAAFHEMKSYEIDTDEWFDSHRRFHIALLAACGNDRLLSLCVDLIEIGDLYLRWARQIAAGSSVKEVWAERAPHAEHVAIMEAALARDPELAGAQYRAHLQLTERLAGRSLTDSPS